MSTISLRRSRLAAAAPRLADIRAAWWAHRALRVARRRLAGGELHQIATPSPPALPASAARGVEALLRRTRHTCLEAALIRQRWLTAHGERRDVVIGVTSPGAGFEAHAWLDLAPGEAVPPMWHELTRVAP